MVLSGSRNNITKHKAAKCTAVNILKSILLATLVLFAASIFITFNLTTSVSNSVASHQPVLESPRAFRKKDGVSSVQKTTTRINESKKAAAAAAVDPSEDDLLQWIKQQGKDDISASSLSEILSTPLYYTPGTLPLSQLATFKHCYTDPSIYSKHFNEKGDMRRAPYSEKHKLALVLLPKSGSSTGRYMMQHEFEATEQHIRLKPPLNVITFVREPLSRFMSQYEEAYVRTAPWVKNGNPYYFDPDLKQYKEEHPFPFMFENLHSYHDYEDTFCPPSTRTNPNSRKECVDKPSAENGTLTHRLERFVSEYDGRTPFDIHLSFQVPLLSNKEGYPIHVTELHNTTNAKEDWKSIAKSYLGEDHVFKDGVIEGRSYPRRLNSKLVSAKTQKRICELALIDYCCLNFPLPSVCGDGDGAAGADKKLQCKMDYDEANKKVRIQPAIFPDVEKS